MEYLRLRTRGVEAPAGSIAELPAHDVTELVWLLLQDMASTQSLALGELVVRRRLAELSLRAEDCDTICGNLVAIAAHGPKGPEDREILCFYFALGLRGRLKNSLGHRRQRLLQGLRETLDFLVGAFGVRVLANLIVLDATERQMVWDLVGGTVLGLGREQEVAGIVPHGALMRWATLFAKAPRADRRAVARALISSGPSPAGRLVLVGILDPFTDADLLGQGAVVFTEFQVPTPVQPEVQPNEAPEGASLEHDSSDDEPSSPSFEVSGRAVRLGTPLQRLISRLTGWALAERLFVAFGAVLLGLHRHGHLRLTRQGLVYDESLRLLGRSVSQRTVAIPLSAVAARLDRRHGVASLLVGLASAMGATFLSVLWTLDGLHSGYWPFFLAAAGVFLVGLVVDLLIFRISGRLRGRSQLVLDGGEGARIRLDGVRRAEAEAMLAALAGPSRLEAFDERPPS
ncbi:MAG: hypothetical protein EXR76_01775 [Myxococcales bacterium]|nr:hypothetical protein [Myxococcales bacterium]